MPHPNPHPINKELTREEYLQHADEIYKYITQIMNLNPAQSITILNAVTAKLINEQATSELSKIMSLMQVVDFLIKVTHLEPEIKS